MNSKIKKIIKKRIYQFIPILLLFCSINTFCQEIPSLERERYIPNLCPSTNNILKFNWFKKFFHPCQTFSEGFKVTNECFDKHPFKVSISAVISLSNKGVELYFNKLSLKKVPPSWGTKVFVGFKILDTRKKSSFKVKKTREIPVNLLNYQFSNRPKQVMIIYGPQKEGGQDEYENLIENELEKVNDRGHFRFYLTISNEDRTDVLNLPGPRLKDLPRKIKQRNTCQ